MRWLVTICSFLTLLTLVGCEGVQPVESSKVGAVPASQVSYDHQAQPKVRGSKEFQDKVAEALQPNSRLGDFIRCYGIVARASYIYPETYDPNDGVVRSNYYPGYSLFLQEDIIISPAIVEGREGLVLYCQEGAKLYQLEGLSEVLGDYLRYDFRLRIGREIFPVSVSLPLAFSINVRLGPEESYPQALNRVVKAFKVQRFAYKIYLREGGVSKKFPLIRGEPISEERAVSMIRQEIVQRVSDILANSLSIGMDFRGGPVKMTGNPDFDSDLRLKEVYKLPHIRQAIQACREVVDSEIQQAANRLAEGLGYEE